jgi:ABC-type sugar transport system permease subunit
VTNGISGRFNGIANYKWIFSDRLFRSAMFNTGRMAVFGIALNTIVCFVIASLINNLIRGKGLFKSLYFLPNVVSAVAVAMLFNFLLYASSSGIVNRFLGWFGVTPIGWLVSPSLAPFSMVMMGLWRSMGYDTILFLAGLQSIPKEMYEAAEVDGASSLKKWWSITIPSMKPVFVFVIMMMTISQLRRFEDIYMIGGVGGNPGGSLSTMVLYVYRATMISRDVGLGSAAAVILFIIILTITMLNNFVMNRKED